MRINLTNSMILNGVVAGALRRLEARQDGQKNMAVLDQYHQWGAEIESVLGEMAVAMATDKFWLGKGVKCTPDLFGAEVRSTLYTNGHLRLQKDDSDDLPFYLVTGAHGVYTVHGWIYGRDGKQEKYWGEKMKGAPSAYWVPQSDLNPMEMKP